MFVPRTDVVRLTGKKRFAAQRRALNQLGIRYVTAATGEPLIREESLDGGGTPGRNRAIRWDRLNV